MDKERFQELMMEWEEKTKYHSSHHTICVGSEYQELRAAGNQILPYLKEMPQDDPHVRCLTEDILYNRIEIPIIPGKKGYSDIFTNDREYPIICKNVFSENTEGMTVLIILFLETKPEQDFGELFEIQWDVPEDSIHNVYKIPGKDVCFGILRRERDLGKPFLYHLIFKELLKIVFAQIPDDFRKYNFVLLQLT